MQRLLLREGIFNVHDISADDVVHALCSADLHHFCARLRDELVAEINFFDLCFLFFVELEALAVEKFNAVVVVWIVARAYHDARVAAHILRKKGNRRSRHRADLADVIAYRGKARYDRCFYHIAASACIFAD